MKPTQEQVIAWAREAGMQLDPKDSFADEMYLAVLKRAFTLAYEAGQESMKWDGIHSCHPDCQRPACVHTRKTYQEGYEAGRKDENEACAEAIKDLWGSYPIDYEDVLYAIRARREQ